MVKRIAVVFGGRSPEHDVSIKTGLQALNALDQRLFKGFPVYIGLDGEWWVGDALRKDANYIPTETTLASLTRVSLEPRRESAGGCLVERGRRVLWSKPKVLEFDVALLALHGLNGEDGRLQGLLDFHGIPYSGMRTMSSALLMDKVATKRMLAATGIPLLPFAIIDRPATGLMPSAAEIEARRSDIEFPCIVKPTHLGSSIGVAKVANLEELRAVLPKIFQLDNQAIIEPCVQNLVEYNVAVANLQGEVRTSAIEQPKSSGELLDFKQKYLSGSGKGPASKTQAQSEGMLSLTRDINPELPQGADANIRHWATQCFAITGGTGTPRIDFLSDSKTGEIWLNEVNPCPGSFAFFLWEAATNPVQFPDLLSALILEAQSAQRDIELPADPAPEGSRLFKRP